MFSSKSSLIARTLSVVAVVTALSLATVSQGTPLAIRANTGDGTYYTPGLGACGITNTDADLIAAMAHATFDSYPGATGNPNTNPICNKKVRATYQGKSVTVAITDRCAGCAGAADLDFSPAAFQQLADEGAGRIHGVTWDYV